MGHSSVSVAPWSASPPGFHWSCLSVLSLFHHSVSLFCPGASSSSVCAFDATVALQLSSLVTVIFLWTSFCSLTTAVMCQSTNLCVWGPKWWLNSTTVQKKWRWSTLPLLLVSKIGEHRLAQQMFQCHRRRDDVISGGQMWADFLSQLFKWSQRHGYVFIKSPLVHTERHKNL